MSCPAILLMAAGMGSIFVPVTLGAVSGVAPEDSGIASAMLNVGQQVGGTLGLSALVAVFSSAARHASAPTRGTPIRSTSRSYVFTHGADMAFKTGAIFALVGLVAAFVLIRVQPVAGVPRRRSDRDERPSSYLLRVRLPDQPGVLGRVATALGNVGADIESIVVVDRADELRRRRPGCRACRPAPLPTGSCRR